MNDTTNVNKSINTSGEMNWQLVIAIGVLFSALTTIGYKFISSVEKQLDKKDLRIEKLESSTSLNRDMYMIAKAKLEEQMKLDSTLNK